GQKTCLHLHGVFPYIYVPYDGCGQQLERHLRQLAFSIDRALNVALGNPSSSIQHVFKVSLVSGTPFYGYHEKEQQFMKIYLYNPLMVKRVCELLQGGAIMNKSYQPHEAHLPYLLQLFIDYNLYGMNLINLASIKFRKARRKDLKKKKKKYIYIYIAPYTQVGRNPGLQSIWEDEKQRRREKNESSQIEPPESQVIDRGFMQATDSEKVFKKRLKEILKQNDFSV
uniref:DNA polymerase delta/zeta catalytic subunit N-terminal domain-containing protein n=1 Tax=Latimeria chalumnae TaxID=7897 RepID=H3ANK2_LATCH